MDLRLIFYWGIYEKCAPNYLSAHFYRIPVELSIPNAAAAALFACVDDILRVEAAGAEALYSAGLQQHRPVLQHHHALLRLHIMFLLHNSLLDYNLELRSSSLTLGNASKLSFLSLNRDLFTSVDI